MTTVSEVEEFLKVMKVKIKTFDIAFRPRDKNIVALKELDILPLDRLQYIKISAGLQNKRVDCMSFHIAEYPITYPLKTNNYESENRMPVL